MVKCFIFQKSQAKKKTENFLCGFRVMGQKWPENGIYQVSLQITAYKLESE